MRRKARTVLISAITGVCLVLIASSVLLLHAFARLWRNERHTVGCGSSGNGGGHDRTHQPSEADIYTQPTDADIYATHSHANGYAAANCNCNCDTVMNAVAIHGHFRFAPIA